MSEVSNFRQCVRPSVGRCVGYEKTTTHTKICIKRKSQVRHYTKRNFYSILDESRRYTVWPGVTRVPLKIKECDLCMWSYNRNCADSWRLALRIFDTTCKIFSHGLTQNPVSAARCLRNDISRGTRLFVPCLCTPHILLSTRNKDRFFSQIHRLTVLNHYKTARKPVSLSLTVTISSVKHIYTFLSPPIFS